MIEVNRLLRDLPMLLRWGGALLVLVMMNDVVLTHLAPPSVVAARMLGDWVHELDGPSATRLAAHVPPLSAVQVDLALLAMVTLVHTVPAWRIRYAAARTRGPVARGRPG